MYPQHYPNPGANLAVGCHPFHTWRWRTSTPLGTSSLSPGASPMYDLPWLIPAQTPQTGVLTIGDRLPVRA